MKFVSLNSNDDAVAFSLFSTASDACEQFRCNHGAVTELIPIFLTEFSGQFQSDFGANVTQILSVQFKSNSRAIRDEFKSSSGADWEQPPPNPHWNLTAPLDAKSNWDCTVVTEQFRSNSRAVREQLQSSSRADSERQWNKRPVSAQSPSNGTLVTKPTQLKLSFTPFNSITQQLTTIVINLVRVTSARYLQLISTADTKFNSPYSIQPESNTSMTVHSAC